MQSPPNCVKTPSCVTWVAQSARSSPSMTSSIDFASEAFGTPGTDGTKSKSSVSDPPQDRGEFGSFFANGTTTRAFLSRHLATWSMKLIDAVASLPSRETKS